MAQKKNRKLIISLSLIILKPLFNPHEFIKFQQQLFAT